MQNIQAAMINGTKRQRVGDENGTLRKRGGAPMKRKRNCLLCIILLILIAFIVFGCSSETGETESPIIYAKRALSFSQRQPVNLQDDVMLVLLIDASYNANLDNSYLLANGQKISFSIAHVGIIEGVEGSRLAAVVPQDILQFELHVSGKQPVTFEAEKEIHDSL